MGLGASGVDLGGAGLQGPAGRCALLGDGRHARTVAGIVGTGRADPHHLAGTTLRCDPGCDSGSGDTTADSARRHASSTTPGAARAARRRYRRLRRAGVARTDRRPTGRRPAATWLPGRDWARAAATTSATGDSPNRRRRGSRSRCGPARRRAASNRPMAATSPCARRSRDPAAAITTSSPGCQPATSRRATIASASAASGPRGADRSVAAASGAGSGEGRRDVVAAGKEGGDDADRIGTADTADRPCRIGPQDVDKADAHLVRAAAGARHGVREVADHGDAARLQVPWATSSVVMTRSRPCARNRRDGSRTRSPASWRRRRCRRGRCGWRTPGC